MLRRAALFPLVTAVALALVGPAAAFDLHAFWDGRCAHCHGHAAAFARKFLHVEAGLLAGTHHKADLKRFLAQHETSGAHADAIYDMLLAQVSTQPAFQQRCAGCHGTAADFARAALAERDGVLVGRTNGRPVADFLTRHGGATPDEAATIARSLARVLRETGGAAVR